MFETDSSLRDLGIVRSLLAGIVPADGSAVMIEQVRVLEELRGLLAATQATVTAAFVTARRAEQAAAGVSVKNADLGISQEIRLARRKSPFRARNYAGWSQILTAELPATPGALRSGETSEWRAVLVARETGWLSREHRAEVDADLGPRLHTLGDRAVEAEAQRLADQLDPHGKAERFRRAAGGRRVTLRPAPDGMSRLGAVLPLTEGVAVIAALGKAADASRAAGDERGRGQVMADELVTRITGQAEAALVPIRVDLIMTDQALFNTGPRADDPATMSGHGPAPAPWARDLIRTTAALKAGVQIRRLFTDPAGRLISMETTNRDFTPPMAELVKLRDQCCTTPYCGAPIRHIDHLWPWAQGGPTSLDNAGGKCEACNYAKQAPGWTISPMPDSTVKTTTPTGRDAETFARVRPPGAPTRKRARQRARHTRDPAPAGV